MPMRRTTIQRKRKPTGLPADYPVLLESIKDRIRSAQIRAALSVSRELIHLYWSIGRDIAARQRQEGWGAAVVGRLSADIQAAFPGIEGFSGSNISRMRAFYLGWTAEASNSAQLVPNSPSPNSAQLVPKLLSDEPPAIVTQIPWGHNIVLLFKLSNPTQRLWYAQQTIANGWSRSMLEHWIESGLYSHQGKAVTNFAKALPSPQSDLAHQLIKDPYNFDFLTLQSQAHERELEQALTDQITRFLLELGAGFAFVGRQVPITVDGEDFYIDLLFYHLGLRCFVVIDLKARKFEPEFAGKMNFYLSAVDDRMGKRGDAPSIGLILCKTRSKVIAEYALRHLQRPVGVARYVTKLTERLPRAFSGKLPTIREIETELSTPISRPGKPKERKSKRRKRGAKR